MRIFILFCLALAFEPVLFAQQKNDLARVAILKFVNESKNSSYSWAETSLPRAIEKSMRARFDYLQIDSRRVSEAVDAVTGVRFATSYSVGDIDTIAKKLNADIIIYGGFKSLHQNRNVGQLVINAVVYDAIAKKQIGTTTERSPIEKRLFTEINRISEQIVKIIYRFATRADRQAINARKIALQKGNSWFKRAFIGEQTYSAYLGSQMTSGSGDRLLAHGPAIKTSASSALFYSWLQPMVNAGFAFNSADEKALSSYMLSWYLHTGISYHWGLPWFKLTMQPFILGGITGGYIKNFNNRVFATSSVELGVMLHYYFRPDMAVSISNSTVFYNDQSRPLLFDMVFVGLSIRR